MSTRTTILSLAAAVAAFGLVGAASAQSRSFDLDLAPGYDRPDAEVVIVERELIQPFNSRPVTQNDSYDAAINEFAGQRYKTDPGLIGGALGGVKRAIFGGRPPQ